MAKDDVTQVLYTKDRDASKWRNKEEEIPKKHQLPQWILIWFYVSSVVCTWDASFIMCRPYSMPGKSLAWIWAPYKYYVTVDQRYSDLGDAYVFAQSLMNYAEVLINIIAIIMHYRQSKHTVPTAFMVNVMTMWKTVLYFLMFTDFCTGSEYRNGNTVLQEIFIMVIPNIIWIFLPTAAMIQLWGYIMPSEGGPHSQTFALNGEAKSHQISSPTNHQQSVKREVLRGPGSGLVQGGNAPGEIFGTKSPLSMTSCIRQRVASNEDIGKE